MTTTFKSRTQVLLPESEMAEIRKLAERDRVTVGEWVRGALREARSRRSSADPEAKLKALRQAVQYAFPAADIEQMLAETERGYEG